MTASPPITTTTPAPSLSSLHAAVRNWTDHVPQNLPYVDLMFAFAHATIGEQLRAVEMLEDARKVMLGPVPAPYPAQASFEEVSTAASRNLLFKAFQHRINQALAGKPHTGPLSAEVFADLDEIVKKGQSGGTNNPYLRADYVIARMREQSRILEPTERVDYYAYWTKNPDPLKKALQDLHAIPESAKLAERIRELHRNGVTGKPRPEDPFLVLHEALPLASRVGPAFAAELLQLVPTALQPGTPTSTSEPPELPRKQGELLARAFSLAANCGCRTEAAKLVDSFLALARGKTEPTRFNFINVVARHCFGSLLTLGLNAERDRAITEIQKAAEAITPATTPEIRATMLQAQLHVASGLLQVGRRELASPILAAARHELLDPDAVTIPAREFTALGQTYLTALGETTRETCLPSMIELFREMNPRKITNTWTTAHYFSRFHLSLVEDAVFAACRLEADQPVIVQA
ncbi:MAG: hypothetical protein U0792_05585 [Gemmataceae bacterium]